MPKTDAEGTHRLTEMTVEEVSLVDRAANRRKYLVVKRDNQMPIGAPLATRPDGSFTAAGGGGAAPAPDANVGAPAADAAPQMKVAVLLTGEAKGALAAMLETVIGRLNDATAMVKGAKEVSANPEDGEEMDALPLTEVILEAMGELEDTLFEVFGADEPAPAADVAAGAPGSAAAADAPPALPPLAKRLVVARAKRVIVKAEAESTARNFVQKYGARMKKERRERFQSALATLMAIASETAPLNVDKARPSTKPAAKAPTAKADATPAAPIDVATHPAFVALQEQAKQNAETLAELRKNGATSNAIPANRGESGQAEASFSWPMDLNDDRFNDTNDVNHFGR